MKFEITDADLNDAIKTAMNGGCEALDKLVSKCDSRLGRNILSGVIRSLEDAANKELSTKQVLSSTTKPAEVTHIEQNTEKAKEHKQTGGIQSLKEAEETSKEENFEQTENTTPQKVSPISD